MVGHQIYAENCVLKMDPISQFTMSFDLLPKKLLSGFVYWHNTVHFLPLGRITILVLCRQSPLNLYHFRLTRGSKLLFLQDLQQAYQNRSERHLTVFCIDLIVVYNVNYGDRNVNIWLGLL